MNRTIFFSAIRAKPFGGKLNQSQVDGIIAILDEWDRRQLTDLRWLAYMLATTKHETADRMKPITEFGKKAYFDKYEPGTRIGKVLGNTVKGDGWRFRGRGYVQLTGRANYAKASQILGVDFVTKPEQALEPSLSAAIMFMGMTSGWFTGVRLSNFLNAADTDWRNARRIINGLDKADLIAGYAQAFHAALVEATGKVKEPRNLSAAAPAVTPTPPPVTPPAEPLPDQSPSPIIIVALLFAVAVVGFVLAGVM